MIPAITTVRLSGARNRADLPLLVLGPGLGTPATTLWAACATRLTDAFDVVAWDLPGHGHNPAVPEEPFTVDQLAEGVLRAVGAVLEQRDEPGASFFYAGVSAGGAVGLQLLLDHPGRVGAAVLLGTGAAALLGAEGDGDDTAQTLVHQALAAFDVRRRLGEVDAPVLVVAGGHDVVTPAGAARELAEGVPDGRLVELEGASHLAPIEAPDEVARLLRHHLLGEPLEPGSHELVAELAAYDLDTAWDRPGLDRRSRSLVTLAALVAAGRHEHLAHELRRARAHGLTATEITELLLHTATRSEVPGAAGALGLAQRVLAEEEDTA